MCPENLWGTLPVMDSAITPLHILKEQATQLGQMTGRILEAEISKPHQADTKFGRGDSFYVDFDIVVPTMNFYRITILKLSY